MPVRLSCCKQGNHIPSASNIKHWTSNSVGSADTSVSTAILCCSLQVHTHPVHSLQPCARCCMLPIDDITRQVVAQHQSLHNSSINAMRQQHPTKFCDDVATLSIVHSSLALAPHTSVGTFCASQRSNPYATTTTSAVLESVPRQCHHTLQCCPTALVQGWTT